MKRLCWNNRARRSMVSKKFLIDFINLARLVDIYNIRGSLENISFAGSRCIRIHLQIQKYLVSLLGDSAPYVLTRIGIKWMLSRHIYQVILNDSLRIMSHPIGALPIEMIFMINAI